MTKSLLNGTCILWLLRVRTRQLCWLMLELLSWSTSFTLLCVKVNKARKNVACTRTYCTVHVRVSAPTPLFAMAVEGEFSHVCFESGWYQIVVHASLCVVAVGVTNLELRQEVEGLLAALLVLRLGPVVRRDRRLVPIARGRHRRGRRLLLCGRSRCLGNKQWTCYAQPR